MQITNISDAKASLSSLIKQVQDTNEPIIIGKAGKPVAVLSAFNEDTTSRTLTGCWRGKVHISSDFDASSDDIAASFYHSTIFPDDE